MSSSRDDKQAINRGQYLNENWRILKIRHFFFHRVWALIPVDQLLNISSIHFNNTNNQIIRVGEIALLSKAQPAENHNQFGVEYWNSPIVFFLHIFFDVTIVNCTPLTFMGTGSYLMSGKLVLDWKRKLRCIVWNNKALESKYPIPLLSTKIGMLLHKKISKYQFSICVKADKIPVPFRYFTSL